MLANVQVKASPAKPKVAGLYGNKAGTIVRAAGQDADGVSKGSHPPPTHTHTHTLSSL